MFSCLSVLVFPILYHVHKGIGTRPFTSLSIPVQPDNVMMIRPFKQPHIGEAVSQCLITVTVKRSGSYPRFIQPCPERPHSFRWHTPIIVHIQSTMVDEVGKNLNIPGDYLAPSCWLPVVLGENIQAEFLKRRQILNSIGKRAY